MARGDAMPSDVVQTHTVYGSPAVILQTLPHGLPFVFVDLVRELQPGRLIRAVKNVTHADVWGLAADQRHFPAEYLLECFGQAAALMLAADRDMKANDFDVLFGSVDRLTIYQNIACGEAVELEVRSEKAISTGAVVEAKALVRGMVVGEARLSASFRAK
jgi:3-hydroxyacyl-[acyl-carrier-protein] dehydratase